jgi:acetolactate synthase I/II/III large subunit
VVELVKPWQVDVPLIWISNWANQDPVLPALVECVGPLAPTLRQLAGSTATHADDWGAARVAAFRASIQVDQLPTPLSGRILPHTVLGVLRRQAPADALMVVDVGSHKIFGSLSWPTLAPNRFFVSNGLSSMGFGLPAAIGATLVTGVGPVLCLTGDAGFVMAMGELAVLAALNTPLIVVVLNDGAIDLIRSQQVRAGKPVHATEFTSPDFCQIAAAYGLPSCRVTSEQEMEAAAARALATGGPFIIEVMLDPVSYPTTPK